MSLYSYLKSGYDNIFDELKQQITVRNVIRTKDSNDDLVENYTDTTAFAIIYEIQDTYIDSDYGLLEIGEVLCYVKPDVNVLESDYIIYNSVIYEVKKLYTYKVKDSIIYKKLILHKLD